MSGKVETAAWAVLWKVTQRVAMDTATNQLAIFQGRAQARRCLAGYGVHRPDMRIVKVSIWEAE